MGDVFFRQSNRFAGFWISTQACGTVVQGKTAETPDFDTFTACQCIA